jgi:CelD/BcsL family acetyltransferase involved in cellulose biosynthesis
VKTEIIPLEGFNDRRCAALQWNNLLRSSATDTVFLTREWQESWWQSFDRSGLLLLAVYANDELKGIAPFFAEEGMVYLVGSGGSDYLDFVGQVINQDTFVAILKAVLGVVPDLVGIRLYHIPERSPTGRFLQEAAARLSWSCRSEGKQFAPAADLLPDAVKTMVAKKSLVRHERFFTRGGDFGVTHFSSAPEISARLNGFFHQHIRRWVATPSPSLFKHHRQQEFYRTLVGPGCDAGWLRFSEIRWKDRTIAYHFGFNYHGTFMWYKPSFEVDLARHSPGEVLLRHLLVEAKREGAHTFDFGLGEEPFKRRFANRYECVRDWGLYPAGVSIPEVW